MILLPIACMLIAEHKRRAIAGDLVTIGRQTVPLSADLVRSIVHEAGLEPRSDWVEELDGETASSDRGLTDRSFFSMFCDARVSALDVSDYEGAELVHDMNCALPLNLREVADFVFDGSCLDNIFDPARAIKSMSHMLRTDGRLFCYNHATPIQSAYLSFSPEWFFDFFEANAYRDVRIYLCAFDAVRAPWDVVEWKPGDSKPSRDYIIVASGEKTERSTNNLSPIQAHYRKLHAGPS